MARIFRQFYTEIGDLNLAYGDHDIIFRRGYTPKRVMVHINNELGLPICQGELNYVSTTIIDDGFILHAKIRTNDAYILWVTSVVGGPDNVTTDDDGEKWDNPGKGRGNGRGNN